MDTDQTWIDLVREATCSTMIPAEAEQWLWSCTCFPFGTKEQTLERLKDYWTRSNGDLELAIDMSHQDLFKAIAEVRKEEEDERYD